MGGPAAWRDFEVELVRADGKTGRVALIDEQVSERGGDFPRVLDFRLCLSAECHRARRIDHEVSSEVGVGFELLDVVAIRAGVGFPIEAAGIIASDVFPVFGELHRRATVGRPVLACHVAEHRRPCLDGQGTEFGKQGAVEEIVFHSSRISLSSRSTIFFEVMPWDSAAKLVMTRWPRTEEAMASMSSSEAM